MKFLMFILLLVPGYSFAEDNLAQEPKVCHMATGRPNYMKIDVPKHIEKSACIKGDIVFLTGLYPDTTVYIASRICELETIVTGGSTVVCKYSGVIRGFSSPY